MIIFKIGYYMADTVNGVYFDDTILEDTSAEVLSARHFQESLHNLDDKEVLTAFFGAEDEGIFWELEKEYGIRY